MNVCVQVPFWQLLSFLQTTKCFLSCILVQVCLRLFFYPFRSDFIHLYVFVTRLDSACWECASRDKVRGPNSGRRVQPNKEDLGTSGPHCLPPAFLLPPACPAPSVVCFHSLKPGRLTSSDLSSLIRSKTGGRAILQRWIKGGLAHINDRVHVWNVQPISLQYACATNSKDDPKLFTRRKSAQKFNLKTKQKQLAEEKYHKSLLR